jgi:hypothetical protein
MLLRDSICTKNCRQWYALTDVFTVWYEPPVVRKFRTKLMLKYETNIYSGICNSVLQAIDANAYKTCWLTWICCHHRWALNPISVISDIGLKLISEHPISDWESGVGHYIGYLNKDLSDIRYPSSQYNQTVSVA